jgi:ribosomal protein S18 acetylase RimI-like enzyme
MKIDIRKYQSSDKLSIVRLMDKFGDYLVTVDQMKRTRRMPGFSGYFTDKMLKNVDKYNGIIYIAENECQIVGFIAGVMRGQSKEELLESVPSKAGRIIELFIDEQFRGKGIGKRLMEKMEDYFRQYGSDVSKVEVFEPNVKAHNFYRKLGYQDRSIEMLKKL